MSGYFSPTIASPARPSRPAIRCTESMPLSPWAASLKTWARDRAWAQSTPTKNSARAGTASAASTSPSALTSTGPRGDRWWRLDHGRPGQRHAATLFRGPCQRLPTAALRPRLQPVGELLDVALASNAAGLHPVVQLPQQPHPRHLPVVSQAQVLSELRSRNRPERRLRSSGRPRLPLLDLRSLLAAAAQHRHRSHHRRKLRHRQSAQLCGLASFKNFTENFGGLRGARRALVAIQLQSAAPLRSGNVNYNPVAGQMPALRCSTRKPCRCSSPCSRFTR